MGFQEIHEAMPALRAGIDRACRCSDDQEMYAEFDHAMHGPLTVVLGEIELVPSDAGVPAEERRRNVGSVVGAVRQLEQMLVLWQGGGPRG